MVRAIWNGEVVADSDDTVVIDRNHYFPAGAVKQAFLVSSDTTTVCGWKGRAAYYSLEINGQSYLDAAWYYPSTSEAARSIEGRIAFGPGVKIEDEGNAGRRRSLFDRFRRDPSHEHPSRSTVTHHIDAPVHDLDDDSFFAALDGQVTIADFWAPWCGPCKTLHPLFDRVSIEHSTSALQFVRVDIDDSPGIASAFNIMSIPTIVVLDAGGNEIDRETGLPSRRRLEQLVRHAGSLAHDSASTTPCRTTHE